MAKTVYPVSAPLADSGTFSGKVAFSRGVKVDAGTMLFVSGALAMDEKRHIVGVGNVGAQTRQVLRNLGQVLTEAGATFRDVVKVTVFTKDIAAFRAIHDARLEFFAEDQLPASTMVEVSGFVHPDALIEIDMVAVLPQRAVRSTAARRSAPRTAQPRTAQPRTAKPRASAARRPARAHNAAPRRRR
jgi:enamine deaminase RidA (YjgF/YER057c/UK114 family)